MHTSVTTTRSKVRVKVTDLPTLQKLHFSTSVSSIVLTWTSKLIVGGDSMRPGLHCLSPIFEFPSRKAITRVQTSSKVDISRNSNGHILVVCDATVTWLGKLLVLHVLCMLM